MKPHPTPDPTLFSLVNSLLCLCMATCPYPALSAHHEKFSDPSVMEWYNLGNAADAAYRELH